MVRRSPNRPGSSIPQDLPPFVSVAPFFGGDFPDCSLAHSRQVCWFSLWSFCGSQLRLTKKPSAPLPVAAGLIVGYDLFLNVTQGNAINAQSKGFKLRELPARAQSLIGYKIQSMLDSQLFNESAFIATLVKAWLGPGSQWIVWASCCLFGLGNTGGFADPSAGASNRFGAALTDGRNAGDRL